MHNADSLPMRRQAAKSAAPSAFNIGPDLLLVPLLVLLLFVFVIPILWFLIHSLWTSGHPFKYVRAVLGSTDVARVLWATNWLSLLVTLATLLMAYPIAYVLSLSKSFRFTLLLACVIVPYFTSIIVRTYSWMVILGRHGLINELLLKLGIVDHPLNLMYNKLGIVIGMSYVLLPYLVLTLLSAMKGIDPNLLRAARSLGASNTYVFRRIYLPLSMHGVLSGSLIVYILSLGFFVTPTLMGGPSDMMIAMMIEREVEQNLNWPLAAALSLVLLAVTLILYAFYYRFTRLDRMMS